MLVLSRRTNETVRFPQLGISVSIVSVKGNRVQVGVDAPPEIKIIRKELEAAVGQTARQQSDPSRPFVDNSLKNLGADRERHDFKNRINRAVLGLHLAQKLLNARKFEAAENALATAITRLHELENQSASPQANCRNHTTDALESPGLGVPNSGSAECESSKDVIEVLLVEDDQNELALMKSLLEMEGYRVHTASNGNEAIRCLDRVKPHCMLLDMQMPECDGPETLKRMRIQSAYRDTPVFAVSGTCPESVGVSIGTDGLSNGSIAVEAWFAKPLNAFSLLQSMRTRTSNFNAQGVR